MYDTGEALIGPLRASCALLRCLRHSEGPRTEPGGLRATGNGGKPAAPCTLLDTGRRWKEATADRECDHRNTHQRQKGPRRSGAPLFNAGGAHSTGGSSFLSQAGSQGSSAISRRVSAAETPTTVAPIPTVVSTPTS